MTSYIAISSNNIFLDYQIPSKSFDMKLDRPANFVWIPALKSKFNFDFNNEDGKLRITEPSTGKSFAVSCEKILKNELPKSRF